MLNPRPNGWTPANGATRPGTGKPNSPEPPRFLTVPLKYWRVTLAITLVCATLAWLLGLGLRQPLWRSQGVLIYTPLPIPEDQKGVYTPPTPQTVIALVKCPNHLEALRSEFGLGVPVRVLDAQFRVTQPPSTQTIEIMFDWPEPETGAAMVNRLMQLQIEHVAKLRRATTGEQLNSTVRNLASCTERLTTARADYQQFMSQNRFHDVKAEAERIDKELSALEVAAEVIRQEHDNCLAQLTKWEEASKTPAGPDAQQALRESAADELDKPYVNRKRQLLDALKAEETKLAETDKKAEAKRRDYGYILPLMNRGAVSRSEAEKLHDEMQLLYLQKENSTKLVNRYKEELSSFPTQFATGKQGELKEQLATLAKKVTAAQVALETKERRAKELALVLRQEAPLSRKVKEVEEDHRRMLAQEALLRQLHESEAKEFAVAASATPASSPSSSDRLKITLGVFGVPMVLFLLGLLAFDKHVSVRAPLSWAAQMGLRVLARPLRAQRQRRGTPAPERAKNTASSHVALRVAQFLTSGRRVVLFVSPNEDADIFTLVGPLSRYLVRRNERVLILDARACDGSARPHLQISFVPDPEREAANGSRGRELLPRDREPPSTFGLVQYLAQPRGEPSEFIWATKNVAVDFMPGGGPCSLTDVLPSPVMHDLLNRLCEDYHRILILGPHLSHTLETELLSGYVDGIIVALRTSRNAVCPGVEDFIHQLQEADAPLLGTVVVD
jgi:hypothetical protein